MQLGWALLGSSTQISSLSPEVAGVWPRMDGEGDKGEDVEEIREEKRRKAGRTRDETTAIR